MRKPRQVKGHLSRHAPGRGVARRERRPERRLRWKDRVIPGSKSVRKVLPLALGAALAVAALAAEAGADLAVSNHPELGEIVVDGAGNTLYVFAPDAQGESTCYETCAANWPPLVSDGEVTAGEGLSQDLVGAVMRTDGS